jgi:hypothetical protein
LSDLKAHFPLPVYSGVHKAQGPYLTSYIWIKTVSVSVESSQQLEHLPIYFPVSALIATWLPTLMISQFVVGSSGS